MTTSGPARSALLPVVTRAVAGVGVVIAVSFLALPPAHAQSEATPQVESLPFRVDPPLRSYVAIRRLESENERHNKEAWLVARTELRPDGSFHYEVLEEGGSEFIRRKVLHEALEKEQAVHREGRTRKSGLTRANYEFSPPVEADGLVRVGLVPRRKDDMLVKGTLVTAPDGEILRIEGELVKRPSFWTRSVRIVRQYDRIDGAHVPVSLDTVAQVRFAGTSTMRIRYEYLEINGKPVSGQPVVNLTRSSSGSRAVVAPR